IGETPRLRRDMSKIRSADRRSSATTIMPERKPAVVVILLTAALAGPALMANGPAGRTASHDRRAKTADIKDGRFALTVDSIMRGPDLVGYAPEGLRWSADSQKLYFEWRKPGAEEATTYVVGREGGAPVRLTDEQKKTAQGGRQVGQGPPARRLR